MRLMFGIMLPVAMSCGVGDEGPPGPMGSTGAQGQAGASGVQGLQGAVGAQGLEGVGAVQWADATGSAVSGVVGNPIDATHVPLSFFDADGHVWAITPSDGNVAPMLTAQVEYMSNDCSGSAFFRAGMTALNVAIPPRMVFADNVAGEAYVLQDNATGQLVTVCSEGFPSGCGGFSNAGSNGCGNDFVIPVATATVVSVPTPSIVPPLHPVLL